MRLPKQQGPVTRYRGSRRLPKLPSARSAGVVLTAVVAAAVVAFGAGAVLPDSDALRRATGNSMISLTVNDRLSAADKANRSDDRPDPASSVDLGAPDVWLLPLHCDYEITTLFAMRWGVLHNGVDLACGCGTPYYAAHDGVVEIAHYNGGYGNEIMLDNGNGAETIYGHGSQLLVTEGQHVKAGQNIGLIGTTGFSTGCHLHFEVHYNKVLIDPIPFMKDRGVDIPRHLEAASGANITS